MKGEDEDGQVRFIALLSLLCQKFHWDHDFWRRMGLNEFWSWVEQVHQEAERERRHGDSWEASEQDPRWQHMRDKRERKRGR